LYDALESILSGNYRLDKRVMLAFELGGAEEADAQSRAKLTLVINKSALARIIEIGSLSERDSL